MHRSTLLYGVDDRVTREAWRVAYWTALLLALALLVGPALGLRGDVAGVRVAEALFWAALAVSTVVAVLAAALGGGLLGSVSNPVAVVLGAVAVAVHGVLTGTTTPDLSPAGVVLLCGLALGLAVVVGVVAYLVGTSLRVFWAAVS